MALREDHIVKFKEAFGSVDYDDNGVISLQELGTAVRDLGQNPTERELQDMISYADSSGNINFPAFLTIMANRIQDADYEDQIKTMDQDPFNLSSDEKHRVFDKSATEVSSGKINRGSLLGVGSPILDIMVSVTESFLDKYDLKGLWTMAQQEHMPLFEEIVGMKGVEYNAGGSSQNTIRIAQWMLGAKLQAATFLGCVGKDKNADILRNCAAKDNVVTNYMVHEKQSTGTCAILMKEEERSFVLDTAAANCYKLDHMQQDRMKQVYEKANWIYIPGFFASTSPETIDYLSAHCKAHGKTFCMNLSAVFVVEMFADMFLDNMVNINYLFGNESEAAAWAKSQCLDDGSPASVAKTLSQLDNDEKNPRVVIITQGPDPTIIAINGKVTEYPVPSVPNIGLLGLLGLLGL